MNKGGTKANKINGFENIKKRKISGILGQNRDPVPSTKCPTVQRKSCNGLKSAVLEINAKGQKRPMAELTHNPAILRTNKMLE